MVSESEVNATGTNTEKNHLNSFQILKNLELTNAK